ncbi:MAG: glycosyltransferase family 39 protein [Elusimicrobia bacterium]|nr:glycosyltransferase family 39 protein [Elusimicrobiota bacterium]
MASDPDVQSGPARWQAVAGAVLVALCIGVNLWHSRRTAKAPAFDDALYLETSFKLYRALTEQGPATFLSEYADSFKTKAPLFSVLPMPFYAVFGMSMRSMQLVNMAMLALLGLYVFLFGRRLYGGTVGLMALAAAMTLPQLFCLSRVLQVEVSLAAVVTGFLYHLWSSEGLSRRGHAAASGLLLGAGLLLKVLFPVFVLGPALLMFFLRWRAFRAERRAAGAQAGWREFLSELEPSLKLVLGLGAAVALTWYAWNLLYVTGYFFRASVGDIASHYGDTKVWSPAVILKYWGILVFNEVSPYYVVLGLTLSAWALVRRSFPGQGTLMLGLWLGLPLVAATLGVNKEARIIAPCLPALALLMARGLDFALGASAKGRLACAVLLVFPVIQYCHVSFGGVLPELTAGSRPLVTPPSRLGGAPLGSAGWDHSGLMERISDAVGAGPAVVALGSETDSINANNMSYFSSLAGHPIKFISYGWMEGRIEMVVARLQDRGATHLLEVRGLPEEVLPPTVRVVEPQVQALIAQGRLPFRRVLEYRPAPGVTAVLYERNGEIRLFGAPPPGATAPRMTAPASRARPRR